MEGDEVQDGCVGVLGFGVRVKSSKPGSQGNGRGKLPTYCSQRKESSGAMGTQT